MSDKFPSWRYGPDGSAEVFQREDDVPKGWCDHPSKVDPLDHDGDGKKGGSLSDGKEVMKALRAEYTEKTGKKPFAGWNEATLREKMGA